MDLTTALRRYDDWERRLEQTGGDLVGKEYEHYEDDMLDLVHVFAEGVRNLRAEVEELTIYDDEEH